MRIYLCCSDDVDDRKRATHIYNLLKKTGYELWYAEKNLKLGSRKSSLVKKKINESDRFILCFSRFFLAEGEKLHNLELNTAMDRAEHRSQESLFIIPLQFDQTAMPISLGDVTTLGWGENFDENSDEYIRLLGSLPELPKSNGTIHQFDTIPTPTSETPTIPSPEKSNLTATTVVKMLNVPVPPSGNSTSNWVASQKALFQLPRYRTLAIFGVFSVLLGGFIFMLPAIRFPLWNEDRQLSPTAPSTTASLTISTITQTATATLPMQTPTMLFSSTPSTDPNPAPTLLFLPTPSITPTPTQIVIPTATPKPLAIRSINTTNQNSTNVITTFNVGQVIYVCIQYGDADNNYKKIELGLSSGITIGTTSDQVSRIIPINFSSESREGVYYHYLDIPELRIPNNYLIAVYKDGAIWSHVWSFSIVVPPTPIPLPTSTKSINTQPPNTRPPNTQPPTTPVAPPPSIDTPELGG